MTIADLLKYIEFLVKKEGLMATKVRQLEWMRVSQRIVSANAETNVVEQTEFTVSPKELTAEYDAVAKELRLARQALEKLNHTTETGFEAKY